MSKMTTTVNSADSKPKDYSATLRAAKMLRDKNDVGHLADSASDLMLYIADPDGYKDNVQTLALACANLFGLFQDLNFLYEELRHEEREYNDHDQ